MSGAKVVIHVFYIFLGPNFFHTWSSCNGPVHDCGARTLPQPEIDFIDLI